MNEASTPELGIRLLGRSLAGEDFTGRTVERQPVAFLEGQVLAVGERDDNLLLVLVHRDGAGAGDAGDAHAARYHRRVAGHAAARRENALGHFHAVDVVRHGLGAHQDDGSLRGSD